MYPQQPIQQGPQIPPKCPNGHPLRLATAGLNSKNPGRSFIGSSDRDCGVFMWGDVWKGGPLICKPKQQQQWQQPVQQQWQQPPYPNPNINLYMPQEPEPEPVIPESPKKKNDWDKFVLLTTTDTKEFADEVYDQFSKIDLFTDGKTKKEIIQQWIEILTHLTNKTGGMILDAMIASKSK